MKTVPSPSLKFRLSGLFFSCLVLAALGTSAAEEPTFDPPTLYLTWQRSPSTTMTVHWHTVWSGGYRDPVLRCEIGGSRRPGHRRISVGWRWAGCGRGSELRTRQTFADTFYSGSRPLELSRARGFSRIATARVGRLGDRGAAAARLNAPIQPSAYDRRVQTWQIVRSVHPTEPVSGLDQSQSAPICLSSSGLNESGVLPSAF